MLLLLLLMSSLRSLPLRSPPPSPTPNDFVSYQMTFVDFLICPIQFNLYIFFKTERERNVKEDKSERREDWNLGNYIYIYIYIYI